MSRYLSILLMVILGVSRCYAATDNNALWKSATDAYDQKRYDDAAMALEQIVARNPGNAEVYYNLGNAYYRLNRVGLSVLNYERALKLDPAYKEAKDNLAMAQSRVSNHIAFAGDIFFINWWRGVTRADKASAWAIAALVSFLLMMALVIFRHFQKSGKRFPAQVPGTIGFICVCMLVVAFTAAGRASEHDAAVVMRNDAPLMNADLKGKPQALIPEGTTVTVKDEKQGWTEVGLADGRIGWLQQGVISKI